MRTTVTLDEDVAASLRAMARERGLSFKAALNLALRSALGGGTGKKVERFRVEAKDLGLRPGIDLTAALRLAAAMEDEEIIAKMERGK